MTLFFIWTTQAIDRQILRSGIFGLFSLCLLTGIGCTLPGGNKLDESEQVFDSRDGYVRAIKQFLKGKKREKVQYAPDELREATGGKNRYHAGLGVYSRGDEGYSPSGAVLEKGYSEDFDPEKFTLRQLHKIYLFVTALEQDPMFRKELGSVIYLLRSRTPVTVYGLRKNNTYGTFTVDYGNTEPGGAIVLKNGRPAVLFSEPEYSKGASSYIGTSHSVRAADLGTFHGHPSSPGPSARDIISSLIFQNDSFIITDRGDANGSYLANLNFLTGEGEGLDLTTTRLPKPNVLTFEDVPIQSTTDP